MDAVTFLLKEHDKIRAKLKRVDEKQPTQSRKRVYNDLVRFLTVHERMEQKEWYPYLGLPKRRTTPGN